MMRKILSITERKLQDENSTKTFFPSQDDSFYMYKCDNTIS